MSYIREISGYCPIQDADTSVSVQYTEVRAIRMTQKQYKKTLDYCDYYEHCHEKLCSIVKNSPAKP